MKPLTTLDQCAALSAQLPKRDWTKAGIGSTRPIYDHRPEEPLFSDPDAEHRLTKRELI